MLHDCNFVDIMTHDIKSRHIKTPTFFRFGFFHKTFLPPQFLSQHLYSAPVFAHNDFVLFEFF